LHLEADHRPHRAHHPLHGWRQRSTFHSQGAVARTKTLSASGAMIVGALEAQLSWHALEAFRPPIHITRRLTAGAGLLRPGVVGRVGIESLLNRPRRQS
jgi:hypothetical protein